MNASLTCQTFPSSTSNGYLFNLLNMNINERIRYRMKQQGLTQTDLVRVTGATKGTVSLWVNGPSEPKGEYLLSLARALSTSPDWILHGKGRPDFGQDLEPAPIGGRMVPIISEVQAGMWREIRDSPQAAEMLLTDLSLGAHAFALTIRGDSMLPDFRDGDRVIIDPDVRPSPGDYVVAINGGNAATFKKYRERGIGAAGETVFELVPLNPDYPTLRSDVEQIDIIGTMMEHRKYRRRS